MPQIKKTFDGGKISEIEKTANTKVPLINPNWTMLVKFASRFISSGKFLIISGNTALPANQSEVQRNCEITITGSSMPDGFAPFHFNCKKSEVGCPGSEVRILRRNCEKSEVGSRKLKCQNTLSLIFVPCSLILVLFSLILILP